MISKDMNGGTDKRASADDIYLSLRKIITSSSLKSGKLPTVSDLSVCYSANYRTVKSALARLEGEGYIDYKPNIGAIVKSKKEIVYIQWEDNPFCGLISEGIRNFVNEKTDLELTVVNAQRKHSLARDSIESFIGHMDGLIVMPFDRLGYEESLGRIAAAGVQIVCVDRELAGVNAGSVTSDDFGGAFAAVSHLLEKHNQPVFYVGNTGEPSSSENRYRGWRSAMETHGYFDCDKYFIDIGVRESVLSEKHQSSREFEIIAAERLFNENRLDSYSVFAVNDYAANRVYESAFSRGYRIGEDVFVAGFGNLPFCNKLPTPLTSVKQCPVELGCDAAKMLYMQINGQISRPVHKVMPTTLVVRASSG
ncbi:substrate-binding domain-containing protein [Limihaloglobus sulfuriphilus]|nr:substrate-binding domain-containing protein [Limihaloglobus sulfuriphilus]